MIGDRDPGGFKKACRGQGRGKRGVITDTIIVQRVSGQSVMEAMRFILTRRDPGAVVKLQGLDNEVSVVCLFKLN